MNIYLRKTIEETIGQIRPADEEALAAAEQRQDILAKPPGSLGGLEEIAIRMAGITGQVIPEGQRGPGGQGSFEGQAEFPGKGCVLPLFSCRLIRRTARSWRLS